MKRWQITAYWLDRVMTENMDDFVAAILPAKKVES